MNEICLQIEQRRDSKISPWDNEQRMEAVQHFFERRSHGKIGFENTTFRSKILVKPIKPHGLDFKALENQGISKTFQRSSLLRAHKTSMRLPPYIRDERIEEKPKNNMNLTQNIISFDVVRKSRRKKLTTQDLKRILVSSERCDAQILKDSLEFLNKNFCLQRRQSTRQRERFLVRRCNYRYDPTKSRIKTEQPR